MASTSKADGAVKAALVVGATVAAVGVAAVLIDYLGAKTGGGDPTLVPRSIEERLDRVVSALNQRFGKRWVMQGMTTLRAGLVQLLPPPLVALLDVIHYVEVQGQQQRWTGYQKRCQAVAMCRA